MKCKEMADIVLKAAMNLNSSIVIASSKYPKDLGSWGIDEIKLDELRRHLSKLTVELKVFDIDDEEFPTFKGKNLMELEIRANQASAKKAEDILKRIGAFHIEQYHVVNLRRKKKDEKEEKFLTDADSIDEETDEEKYLTTDSTPIEGVLEEEKFDKESETNALSKRFKDAIELYTGKSVKKIEYIEDPKVENTYAIRSESKKGKKEEWLLVHYKSSWTVDDISDNLEEAEFTKWPPASGNLKFFIW